MGTALAVATAWRGGTFDNVVSSGLDVLFAFPAIVLAIIASVVWGAGLTSATIALAVAYTPYIARILRGAALRERAREYVAALEVQGLRATAICVRHIARNLLPLIAAQGAILFGYAIVDLAAISFIGLGVQPPAGRLGRHGRQRTERRAAGLPHGVAVRRPVHRARGGGRQPARRTADRPRRRGGPMTDSTTAALLAVDALAVELPLGHRAAHGPARRVVHHRAR